MEAALPSLHEWLIAASPAPAVSLSSPAAWSPQQAAGDFFEPPAAAYHFSMVWTTIGASLAIALGMPSDVETADSAAIEIVVDPRIELLAAVQVLAAYDWTGLLTRHDFPYKTALREPSCCKRAAFGVPIPCGYGILDGIGMPSRLTRSH